MPEEMNNGGVRKAERPFTPEQERELERERVREIEPILEELDEWRKSSLAASIRI